jgi:hypothetical protein
MRQLILAICILVGVCVVDAATVTGTILDPTGTPRTSTRVAFTPRSTPTDVPAGLVTTKDKILTTDSGGSFSTALEAGDYYVTIDRDRISISVPDSASTYDLTDLTTTSLVYTRTVVPEYIVKSGDTMTGNLAWSPSTNYDSSAGLIVKSMTEAKRNLLSAVNGMIIYNTSSAKLNRYENGIWDEFTTGPYSGGGISGVQANNVLTNDMPLLGAGNTNIYSTNAVGYLSVIGAQPASTNLTSWSSTAPSAKQDADADLLRLAAIASVSGDVIYRDATGWTNLGKGSDGTVLKLASGLPTWGIDDAGGGGGASIDNDAFGVGWDGNTTNGASKNALYDWGLTLQVASTNLNSWSALAPSAKQDASANLTSWSALAPSAKQDSSANLSSWSALAPSAKQDADADLLRLAAIASSSGDILYRDATGWTNLGKGSDGTVLKLASGFPAWGTDNTAGTGASIDDDAFGVGWNGNTTNGASKNALYDWGVTLQPASTNLTNWSATATTSKQDSDADLLRLAAIASSSGDLLYRDATGWTNLAKGSDGTVLKLASGFPAWGTDNTAGTGASIDDDAFGVGWNGNTTNGASKNALYDWGATVQTGASTLTNLSTNTVVGTGPITLQSYHKRGVNLVVASSTTATTGDYTCDGAGDNVEINAALAALPASGGTVMLTDGTFTLTNSITIPNNATLKLSHGTKIIAVNNFTPTVRTLNTRTVKALVTNSDHTNGNTNVNVIGPGWITLAGTTQQDTNSFMGIWLEKTTNGTISGLEVSHILEGITQDGGSLTDQRYYGICASESSNIRIEDCFVHDTGDDCIDVNRSSTFCIVSRNRTQNSRFGHGIQVTSGTTLVFGSAGWLSSGNIIANNVCNSNALTWGESGITVHGATRTVIDGNHVYDSEFGIVLQGDVQHTTITGNKLANLHSEGIVLLWDALATNGHNNTLISGNSIDLGSTATNGIYINGVNNGTIIGNHIQGAANSQRGIWINNSTNFFVSGNHIKVPGIAILEVGNSATNRFVSNETYGSGTPGTALASASSTALGLTPGLQLASGAVNQPFASTVAETNAFFDLQPISPTSGGARLTGMSDGDSYGTSLRGFIGSTDPTDTIAAVGIMGARYNGSTGKTAMASGETVFEVDNDTNLLFKILGSGSFLGMGNMELSDTNMSQPFLSLTPTPTTWFSLSPISTTLGGARITGISDSDSYGLTLRGLIGSTSVGVSNSAVLVIGARSDGGTDKQVMSVDSSILSVYNDTYPVLTVLGDGDTVSYGNYENRDVDVTNPFTNLAAHTNIWSLLGEISNEAGGARLTGFSDTDSWGLSLRGMIGSTDPTDTTAAVLIVGAKSNGSTDKTALGNAETVLQVLNNTTPVLDVLGNGDAYFTGMISAQDSDVSQPFTTLVPTTNTWLSISPTSGTIGGARISGITDGDSYGLTLRGLMGTADPTDTIGAVLVIGAKSNGSTDKAALGSAETVLQVLNNTTPLMTVLGNGASTFTGELTTPGTVTSNYMQLEQATLNVSGTATNFLADMIVSPYQLITATNHVAFTNAANVVAGRWTTILIDANGADRNLTIPSTWFRKGFSSGYAGVTNGTVGILSLYGYGSNVTNVIATYSYATK